MTRHVDLSDLLDDDNIESLKNALTASASLISNPKAARVLAASSIILGVGRTGYKWLRSRKTQANFRIRILETDPLYDSIQQWLINALPYDQQKNLIVTSRQATDMESSHPSNQRTTIDKDRKVLNLYYDGDRRQEILIGGQLVTVHIVSPNTEAGQKSSLKNKSMVIECASEVARKAVMETLDEEARKSYIRRPRHYTAAKWASFKIAADVPVRPIESVVLRNGQRDKITGDLHTFLGQEEAYKRLGIPWHLGMLLYGPPGSGKTSIATAIAHTMNLDVYTLPLSSVESDTDLLELLSEVNPRSILLLEDIDIASAATDRDDERRGVTMSGLLNALDGIATPHGIITIMTTNHFETLDDALFRSGRVDILEEIGYVDDEQISNLCSQFIGYVPEDLPSVTDSDMIVAADIVSVFKKNLETPENLDIEIIAAIHAGKAKASGKRAKKGTTHVSKTQPVLETEASLREG